MIHYRRVLIVGIIEILIGGITLFANIITLILGTNTKSISVLILVTIAALISTFIGIGILFFKKTAYNLLLFFSWFVLLEKVLIIFNVIQLNGELEVMVPSAIKTYSSIAYHGAIIYILNIRGFKRIFFK